MVSNWQVHTLESICEGIFDCPHSTPKLSDSGPYMVRTQDIRKGYFDTSAAVHVSQEVYQERIKRVEPSYGDLVLSREGTYFGDAAEIPRNTKVCLGQRMVLIRPNRNIIRPKFLRIYINSPAFQARLRQYRDGTVAERLNLPVIRKLPIEVPPLAVQKDIEDKTCCLEDRSVLNRQTNQTLEAMAQALFKSWFVDFDSVIDNALAAGHEIPSELQARAEARKSLQARAEQRQASLSGDRTEQESGDILPESIRQLFPNRFVLDAQMGWIPEGWETGTFKDIANHIRVNIKPEDINDSDIYVGLEHIGKKQVFLTEHGSGADVESNKSGFKTNDLLFGKLRPYFHKVCLAPKDGICSTDILVFRAKQSCYHSFMALTAYTESFVEYADLRSTGTRMPRASAKDMLAYQIVLPPKDLAVQFENIVQPVWNRGFASVVSSDEAAKLRDTLLPKLISGELRLPDEQQPAKTVTT